MPTKRTRTARGTRQRVTERAVAAFKAKEWMTLHRELGLKPWEMSPLDVDDGPCPDHRCGPYGASWPKAQALRAELEEACRDAD